MQVPGDLIGVVAAAGQPAAAAAGQPDAPSRLVGDQSLEELVRADLLTLLAAAQIVERFLQLPFFLHAESSSLSGDRLPAALDLGPTLDGSPPQTIGSPSALG